MKRISILMAILSLFSTIMFAQSECRIENLVVEALPCNGQQKFAVVIDFTPVNPASNQFKVQGNGINHGIFSYADLPITIDGLPGNCTTPYEFVIRDTERPECSAVYNLGKICCNTVCDLKVINLVQKECIEGEFYKINFDVLPPAPGSLGFDVFLNGSFHSFYKYSATPVENFVIPNHGQDQDTLVICNNDNANCCDTLYLSNKCSCFIENARTQVIECNENNDTYFLRVNFDHGKNADSFLIGGAAVLYGTFAYNKLPVVLGPLPFSASPLELLVADKNDVFCFGELTVPAVKECIACNLRDVTYEILPCNENGKIYIKFKFKSSNPGVKGFVVRGNGVIYGQFPYGKEEYYLGPITPDCQKAYEFVIVDAVNNNCQTLLAENKKLCCTSCEIGALTIEEKCTQNTTGISLQFNHAGLPNDSVAVYINGTLVGKYKKGSDPLFINYPFTEDKAYAVKVIALRTDNCFRAAEFVYDCVSSEPCAFKDPAIELSECNADNVFKVFLKFTAVGQHSDLFTVTINDQFFGPFPYGQNVYTIGPVHKACEGIRIVLRDKANESCKLVLEKEINKCCEEECELSPGIPEAICFEQQIIGVKVKVEGIQGNKYRAYLDGADLGTFSYSAIPVLYNIGPRPEGKAIFKFIDVEDPTCFVIKEVYLNCHNCAINHLKAEPVECTETTFKFNIDFDVTNSYSDSFFVFINNVKIGRYAANQLPLLSPTYDPRADQVYIIKVFDAGNEACRSLLEVPFIECEQTATHEDDFINHQIRVNNGVLTVIQNEVSSQHFVAVYALDGKILSAPKRLLPGENEVYQSPVSSLVALVIRDEARVMTKLVFLAK